MPAVLPSFINVIYHKCAEDKEDEECNEHVVNSSDVVHFKQLTGNANQTNHKLRYLILKYQYNEDTF